MNFKKIVAAVAAAAVAVTTMAVSAFATVTNEMYCLVSDDSNVPVFSSIDEIAGATSFTITFTSDVDLVAKNEAGEWYNFGVILNSNSTGWKQAEANISADAGKQYVIAPTDNAGEYKIEHKSDTPIFAATDTYAQIWLQDWSNDKTGTYTVTSVELFDANGNLITPAPKEEAPAETEAPAEEAPAEEAPAEEVVEDVEDPTAEDAVEEIAVEDEPAVEEAPAETEAPVVEEAPEADGATTATATGNTTAAAIVAVMAIAGAAAVAANKRK